MKKKLDIDREVNQGDICEAKKRVKFCLDQLEKHGFSPIIDWNTEIAPHLSVEEIVGALVSAEQTINTLEEKES